jgi:hypothetical protein
MPAARNPEAGRRANVPTCLADVPISLIVVPTCLTVVPTSFTVIPTSFTVIPTSFTVIPTSLIVIPAKAGIHCPRTAKDPMDSRFRGNDGHSSNGIFLMTALAFGTPALWIAREQPGKT